LGLFNGTQAETVGNPKKNENCKRAKKEKKKKKNILCHEIEPNPSKDRAMHEGDNRYMIPFYLFMAHSGCDRSTGGACSFKASDPTS
jgi:hypothetical protein